MTYARTYYNVLNQDNKLHRFSRLKQGSVSRRSSEGYETNNSYIQKHVDVSFGPTRLTPNPPLSLSEPEFVSLTPPRSVVNQAVRKLQQKLEGDTSQLLTAVAEWESSLKMISARSMQLWSAYRALRNWDIPRVARTLGFSPSVYARQRVERMVRLSRPTEAWLEYWMGWAPLMSDIYNAIDVIQRPPPKQHCRASAHSTDFNLTTNRTDSASSFFIRTSDVSWQYSIYADVAVTNSNLFIANQLGLLNPAQTAWELVPFSFVVDWFTNVGSVLNNLNRFAGLTITNSGSALKKDIDLKRFGAERYIVNPYGPVPYIFSFEYYKCTGRASIRSRSPGPIPIVQPTIEFPKLSLTRAATSVSLLTEIFLTGDGKLLKR